MLRLGDDCYQRRKSCADRAVLSCGSVQRPTSTFSSLLCSLLNNCLSSSRSAIPARYFKRKLAPSLFEWTLQPKATTVAYHFVKIQIVFFFWMYKSSSQYDERLRQCLSITVHCFLKEKKWHDAAPWNYLNILRKTIAFQSFLSGRLFIMEAIRHVLM